MDSKLPTKTQKFFAYCRESIDLESGIKIQKEIISKYAETHGLIITKWFIDNDSSAYLYRPNYENMMSDLSDVDGIICSNLSRFGRSIGSVFDDKQKLNVANKELILIKESLDTTTPQGRLMFGIYALFNDFEHDLILERTRAGLKHAKKHGTKSGKPMHRPPKKVDWKQFDALNDKKVSIPSIAKILGMTKKTLYNKIKERTA